MGNSVVVSFRQGNQLQITSNLIQDFQEEIRIVDQSMSGLSTSLDSLRTSCELFLRHFDAQQIKSHGNVAQESRKSNEDELVVQMLKTIDENIMYQKTSVMSSLKKLLRHIIDIGRPYIDKSDEMGMELSIDKHVLQQEENGEIFHNPPYYESRVSYLRKELEASNALNKKYRDEIDILNKTETISLEERNTLRRRYIQIAEELRLLKEEMDRNENIHREQMISNIYAKHEYEGQNVINDADYEKIDRLEVEDEENREGPKHLADENKRLTEMNQTLKSELEMIKSKEFKQVQLINTGSKTMPVAELKKILHGKIDTNLVSLHITERNNKDELKSGIPVLVLCQSFLGPSNAATDALKGIKVSSEVALVIVHRDVQPTFIRSSKAVILNQEYRKLGGIFDLVNDFQKGIYTCQLNDDNISSLVSFINSYEVRISQAKMYGLCD